RLRTVQPGSEGVAAGDGEALAAQQAQSRVVCRVPAWCAHELGLAEGEPRLLRLGDRPCQRSRRTPGVDRAADAVQLIGRGAIDARGDEQPIERELDVEPAHALVADRQADVLLDR